jgi:hypothetical protein
LIKIGADLSPSQIQVVAGKKSKIKYTPLLWEKGFFKVIENEQFKRFVKKKLFNFRRIHDAFVAKEIEKNFCPNCGYPLIYRGFEHKNKKFGQLSIMVCNDCEFYKII